VSEVLSAPAVLLVDTAEARRITVLLDFASLTLGLALRIKPQALMEPAALCLQLVRRVREVNLGIVVVPVITVGGHLSIAAPGVRKPLGLVLKRFTQLSIMLTQTAVGPESMIVVDLR